MDLALAFSSALPAEARAEASAFPELGRRLEALVAEARGAWPDVELGAADFVAFVAARVPLASLGQVAVGDLYLACAAGRGHERAVAALQATYFGEVDAAGRIAGVDPSIAADARQNLARTLFTGEHPAILGYAGRGGLRGWIRVSGMREVLRLAEKAKRDLPTDEMSFLDKLSPVTDPELAFLKEHYREDFAAAFHAAVGTLTPRERELLHHQVIDGWNIDDFAEHHGVHRATCARWLQAVRATLLEETRTRLKERWGGTTVEIDSIIRLLSSRLDLSVERAIRGK